MPHIMQNFSCEVASAMIYFPALSVQIRIIRPLSKNVLITALSISLRLFIKTIPLLENKPTLFLKCNLAIDIDR